MRKNKNITFKNHVKFAIIVDGDCEAWYFQMLKRHEKLPVDLKPEIPQKKELKDQYEKVIEYAKHFDKVFWIVDYDVIYSESRLIKRGVESPKQAFKKYIDKVNKDHHNVVVIINNPCLEFWLLLHFETTARFFENCDGATRKLKKHLPDYEKTRRYYTKQDSDIYLKLKPKLKDAIANATILPVFNLDHPDTAISQMQLFFETKELRNILSYV